MSEVLLIFNARIHGVRMHISEVPLIFMVLIHEIGTICIPEVLQILMRREVSTPGALPIVIMGL